MAGTFTEEQALALAEQVGFTHYGILNTKALVFRQEARDMCSADRCNRYGKCWTCPPYCGTLEESREKAEQFNSGIILQSTGDMEDDFDYETIQETARLQKERILRYAEELQKLGVKFLPMTAGTCEICEKCACPDAPCRFPEKAFVSMEAYGLIVNDVCTGSGVKYNYGRQKMTFIGCVLFNV